MKYVHFVGQQLILWAKRAWFVYIRITRDTRVAVIYYLNKNTGKQFQILLQLNTYIVIIKCSVLALFNVKTTEPSTIKYDQEWLRLIWFQVIVRFQVWYAVQHVEITPICLIINIPIWITIKCLVLSWSFKMCEIILLKLFQKCLIV